MRVSSFHFSLGKGFLNGPETTSSKRQSTFSRTCSCSSFCWTASCLGLLAHSRVLISLPKFKIRIYFLPHCSHRCFAQTDYPLHNWKAKLPTNRTIPLPASVSLIWFILSSTSSPNLPPTIRTTLEFITISVLTFLSVSESDEKFCHKEIKTV